MISPYNGFHANINLDWFQGSDELPEINYEPFYWYVFALQGRSGEAITTYHVCDASQMKEWVLDFDAPQGNDHQDHHDWRGEIQVNGRSGYFRWGDEPVGEDRPNRHITLRNVNQLFQGAEVSTSPAKDTGDIKDDTTRREVTTTRVVRDTALARRVKAFHNHECQLCGKTLLIERKDLAH